MADGMWTSFRDRVAATGVDFALQAFWVAVAGAGVSGALVVLAFWRGLPVQWLFAFAALLFAYSTVILLTGGLVVLRARRSGRVKRVGKKGFANYRVDLFAAITAHSIILVRITKETSRITAIMEESSKRVDALGKQHTNPDKHGLHEAHRAARKIGKRVEVLDSLVASYEANNDLMREALVGLASGESLDWRAKGVATAMKDALISAIPVSEKQITTIEGIRNVSDSMDLVAGDWASVARRHLESMRSLLGTATELVQLSASNQAAIPSAATGTTENGATI